MSDADNQRLLPFKPAPAADTLERLFRVFGDELIPTEEVRAKYFRTTNKDTFGAALGTERIPLPVTTLDNSQKAAKFINIRHLAAYIEQRAWEADQQLAARCEPDSQTA
tara:strand:- start:11791 stop:12117 length:327 start_codon:yes stop_codon:yes gene_type:complete